MLFAAEARLVNSDRKLLNVFYQAAVVIVDNDLKFILPGWFGVMCKDRVSPFPIVSEPLKAMAQAAAGWAGL